MLTMCSSLRKKIPAKPAAVAQKTAASSTEGGPLPANRPLLIEPTSIEAPAKDRPLVKPRPQPRLKSPGTLAAMRDDVDEGFNVATNRRIVLYRANIRTRARIDAIAAAADTDRQIKERSILEQLAHREAPPWRDNRLRLARDERNDDARVEGQDNEDGQDGDGDCGAFDGDSDAQRRALNKVVRLGLDANDPFVQSVLRQGSPPKGGHVMDSSESEDDSDSNGSEPEADESDHLLLPDDNSAAPAPDVDGHFYEYNFNTWSRYFGAGPRPGTPTAVERLSWYRIDEDSLWLEIPNGMRIPRLSNHQDKEAAQHELTCSRTGIAARRELPVFKEPVVKRVVTNPRALRQRLAELGAAMELDPTKVAATESEGSGSDYSETERDVRIRKGIGSGDEDDDEEEEEDSSEKPVAPAARSSKGRGGGRGSSDDSDDSSDSGGGEEGTSSKKSKGKKAAKVDNSKGKEKADANGGESNNKSKGKEKAAINEDKSSNKSKGKGRAEINEGNPEASGGRPSAEQLECVKELREAIDERIGEISTMFDSTPESIVKQLGLGFWRDVRKMSLWNMFAQIRSLEGAREDVKGCE